MLFRQMVEDYPIQGLKLYTAEWRNGSKGWRLNDPWAYKYFELAGELGVKTSTSTRDQRFIPSIVMPFDVARCGLCRNRLPQSQFYH